LVYPDKPPARNPEVGFFDEDDTKRIIQEIAKAERLTIFVGAGIAADLEIPNWSGLVARLLERMERRKHEDDAACRKAVRFAIDFFHLMPTASIVDALYADEYGDQAVRRRNEDIAAILYPRNGQPAKAHVPPDALAIYVLRLARAKRLAGCDVHIVTTNYDDSLEWIADNNTDALSDLGSDGVAVFSNDDAEDDGKRPGVPVSHLHGLIPRAENGREVVFSEREYIRWDRESRWRDYLARRVAGGGVTLFVGASLRDYNIAAMIRRFSRSDVYALLPVEDEVGAYSVKNKEKLPRITERYASLRGQHLGVEVLRPDFYGQVCQFLNEAAIPTDLDAANYSDRLRSWWQSWQGDQPYGTNLLVERCESLRDFCRREHAQLANVEHVKAEIWVRANPDVRQLQLYSTSQTVVLPGEGYWPHSTKIEHLSRYAAVSALAARSATERRVDYRNDNRWTHCLAVPLILPEKPYFELPVGVMILLLHAPGVEEDKYFGDAHHEHMRDLAVRMKGIGQNFLRPVSSS
jgi:hypothetical protein